ncbi:hypothetical protein SAMN02745121_06586 [Nannocystis exedens]|uniref:Uncharacterized protein n=1 Tax=Nannocystis exedens TaxID=54 RepID=A0A1I2FFQ2_9BACT|nr:hypothetical protein NAEX_03558 [Nannocystis exedens]SFF03346.1 hypothetical protein SAMN02745121_06586 [Nannocystis exedens]
MSPPHTPKNTQKASALCHQAKPRASMSTKKQGTAAQKSNEIGVRDAKTQNSLVAQNPHFWDGNGLSGPAPRIFSAPHPFCAPSHFPVIHPDTFL